MRSFGFRHCLNKAKDFDADKNIYRQLVVKSNGVEPRWISNHTIAGTGLHHRCTYFSYNCRTCITFMQGDTEFRRT